MLAAGKAETRRGIPSGSSPEEGILSEPSPYDPERTAVHGLASTGSPVDQNPKVLATRLDGDEGESGPLFAKESSEERTSA